MTDHPEALAVGGTGPVAGVPQRFPGPVALAACLQLDFAVPNFFAQEHVIDLTSASSADLAILRNPEVLVAERGHIPRLTGPGLGIEIDLDVVARHPFEPELPQRVFYADGSVGDW